MKQYIVLQPISPQNGLPILPAPAPTEEEPNPPPVLVDETIFTSPDSERILIRMGVIAPYEAEKKLATNKLSSPPINLPKPEEE